MPKFIGGESKSLGLAQAYSEVAKTMGCTFFDSGKVIAASETDGIHLDANAHLALVQRGVATT